MKPRREPGASPEGGGGAHLHCLCPHCGRKIRFKLEHAGRTAPCPNCHKPLLLATSEEVPEGLPERSNWITSAVAWGTSAVFHILLLVSFAGIAWWPGLGSGGHARGVGLVEDMGPISIGDMSLRPPDIASGVDTYELGDGTPAGNPEVSDPITDLGGSEPGTAANEEMTLGVLAGGGTGAAGAEISALMSGLTAGLGGRVGIFGASALGETVVYVIDRSDSMSEAGKLDDAKWELEESIRRLAPNQEFYIIFYSTDAQCMEADTLQRATPDNKDRFLKWAKERIEPSGWTNPIPALQKALSLRPDIIFLHTDGVFTASPSELISADAVCAAIRRVNRRVDDRLQTAVHTIAFYDDQNREVFDRFAVPTLKRIAGENEGTYTVWTKPSGR